MNWRDYISSEPTILFGKPVIKGTRIPVDLILEKLGHEQQLPELLEAYPNLTKEAVLACLFFAADVTKHEKILAVA